MGEIGVIILFLGILCLPISIIVLVIRALLKKNTIKNVYFCSGSMAAIIIGFVMIIMTPDVEETSVSVDSKENVNFEVKQEQNEVVIGEEQYTTNGYFSEEDEVIEEDFYLEESINDDSYWEETDNISTESVNDVDEYIDYGEELHKEVIGQAEEYMYPFSEFPYENKKKSKKAMELYKKAMSAAEEEFIYLEEVSEVGLFSGKEIHYKKTIDKANALYKYYGKVNKNSEPEGMGVLIENGDSTERRIIICYIGEFDNGYLDGYGIEYSTYSKYELTVAYEGEFKRGKYDGKGTMYSGAVEYGGTQIIIDWRNAWGTDEPKTEYDYLFEGIDEGEHYVYPVAVACKWYEGKFKEGKIHGEGKEYSGVDNNKQPILVYEGNFEDGKYSGKGKAYHYSNGKLKYEGQYENGKYHGKGTLYDEQGNVIHKGKFKKGEVE